MENLILNMRYIYLNDSKTFLDLFCNLNHCHEKLSLTAIIEKSTDRWYVGQIEEFPDAVSQGKSIDELKDNLLDALSIMDN